jgi:hypothetical protein
MYIGRYGKLSAELTNNTLINLERNLLKFHYIIRLSTKDLLKCVKDFKIPLIKITAEPGFFTERFTSGTEALKYYTSAPFIYYSAPALKNCFPCPTSPYCLM